MRDHTLFLAFWGVLVLLGTIEFITPQIPGQADRKRRWFTNFGLGLLNSLIVSAIPVTTIAAAVWAQEAHFGFLNWLNASWWVALFVTVLVASLADYTFHILSHKVPFLWRLHRVHHSDVHLDLSSALRNHPAEMVITLAFQIAVAVIFGLSPAVLAAYEVAKLFANLLTHANLKVPDGLERLLRLLFVTPYLHRIHHSPLQKETDSNYGNIFTVWDRAYGTYRVETIRSDLGPRFGIADVSRERASNLQSQLTLPWEER